MGKRISFNIRLCLLSAFISSVSCAYAGMTIDEFLQQIELNNLELSSARSQIRAEQLANRTDISLDDPEVEFKAFFLGEGVNEYELEVTQGLDFQTILGIRSRAARKKNSVLDAQYLRQRSAVLYNGWQLLANYAYLRSVNDSMRVGYEHVVEMSNALKRRLDAGDGNIIEYQSLYMTALLSEADIEEIAIQLEECIDKITTLNGGKPVNLEGFEYEDVILPSDFDNWYNETIGSHPSSVYYLAESEAADADVKINGTTWLPKVWAGYSGRFADDAHVNGLLVGMSVPLWANINKLRSAKAARLATEDAAASELLTLRNNLCNAYRRATRLQSISYRIYDSFESSPHIMNLSKALNSGQMELHVYLMYLRDYYETLGKVLQLQMDYRLACIELLYGTK